MFIVLLFLIIVVFLFIFVVRYYKNISYKDVSNTWWKPGNNENITWQWQLDTGKSGRLDLSYDVDMYDVDLFDTDKSTIDELHRRDKIVVCYFSAGTVEYGSDRPDIKKFENIEPSAIGNVLEDWENERWLDIRNKKVWKVMEERIKLAKEKGCDGIEPDNINAFEEDNPELRGGIEGVGTGFNLNYKDQLKYNRFIAETAHKHGLSVGLKNNIYQTKDLVKPSKTGELDYYDWALNEMCYQYSTDDYDECAYYDVFDKANKAVFGVEYGGKLEDFCPDAKKRGRYWIKKRKNLDSWRKSCN